MRKIKDSAGLQQKVDGFYDQLDVDGSLIKHLDALKKLRHSRKTFGKIAATDKKLYIATIEQNYLDILKANWRDFDRWKTIFNGIIPAKKVKGDFAAAVVAAMGYDKLREKEFPGLFQQLEIKTCIYCHSQLTLVIDKILYKRKQGRFKAGDVKKRSAKLELDHFNAKSDYPFLSASFYNLYPVCANCNKSKSDRVCTFELYADSGDLDAFRFKLTPSSVIDYWSTSNKNRLKIEFHHLQGTQADSDTYNTMFDILKIYETQTDIVEELVHKKVVYNKVYRENLARDFAKLFPDPALIQRLIIGNYDKPEDIHKRPMAKFVQDIAVDILLIKKPK